MSKRDADDDMPRFPWPARQDVPSADDTVLLELLADPHAPVSVQATVLPVADVLAALTAPPSPDELAGSGAVLAEYRRRHTAAARAERRPRRRRAPLLAPVLTLRAAAIATVVLLGLGGFTTAAFARALPAPMQQLAHVLIGAPNAAGPSPAPAQGRGSQPGAGDLGHGKPTPAPGPSSNSRGKQSAKHHHGRAHSVHRTHRPHPTHPPHPTRRPHPTRSPRPTPSARPYRA